LYHLHDDNSVNLKNNAAQKRLNGIDAFCKKYPILVKKFPRLYLNTLYGETHFSLVKYYIIRGMKWKAMKHLLLSLYYQKTTVLFKHKVFVLLQLLANRPIPEYNQSIVN
jgi:hypothetical protein